MWKHGAHRLPGRESMRGDENRDREWSVTDSTHRKFSGIADCRCEARQIRSSIGDALDCRTVQECDAMCVKVPGSHTGYSVVLVALIKDRL